MSSNKVYTYQHTCKKSQPAYILEKAPFKSVKRVRNGKTYLPFLGEGYYLWEENSEAAKRWGNNHYNDLYNIVEYEDMEMPINEFLDLTDRRSIKYFKDLQEIYLKLRPESSKWKIAAWIEFFKKISTTDYEKFPFNYIKADEHLPEKNENNELREKVNFVESMQYYTYLSPLYMLCVIDKSKMSFKSKKILQ